MKQSVGDLEATVESSDTGIDNNTPKRAIPGTPSSETLSGGETEDLTQLPKMDIAGLEHVDFVRQFKLVHSQPTNFGLSPNNIVTIPAYIKDILADQELATRGSPMNNALVKCRVETIILTTLANIKCHAGSCRELQSLNVQFDREIHLPWKLNRKIFNLSGTVDYSLWDGKPSERVTDTVVVKTETTPWLKRGMYHCLIYMAMIHHTRKRAGMPDTSIFGVATDGFEWVFIRIRPDNHVRDLHMLQSPKYGY
ncbi:hypothetical protein N7535_009239 [Penicillium sp. DV-2018c]|nr:hypothetical protein N7535_009239 [Penicillium sp. DV-2018c]